MDAPTPAEILFAEHLARIASGEGVDLDGLCVEHPEHETALRILALAHGTEAESATSGVERMIREKLAGEPPLARLPGGRAERYTIRREIGRGGMGVVYEAWDEDLGRALAMKVVQSAAGLERFLDEARITGRLDHPGVLPVHELGLDAEGRAFFTMPLIEGSDLETILRRAISRVEGWSLTRALEVLVRVCDTLAYAHSRGVIHRDLKPQNIMVGRFGETYVMDWGLARDFGEAAAERPRQPESANDTGAARSPHRTWAGAVLGTPAYMPPEQAAGDLAALDERSDIYAVGAMLYTLLTGQRPYASPGSGKSSREVVASVLAGPPARILALNRAATPELVAICERAMARAKEDRYATMKEVADDVRAFLERRVVRAYRTGAIAELQKWVARNRVAAAAAALALLALTGFLFWREVTRREIEDERNQKSEALVRARNALSEKETALSEKEKALRRSEANRLTALSIAQLPTDPTLALLLALDGAALDPSPVARNALLAALGSVWEKRILEGHRARVSAVDFDPSGRRLLTGSLDGTVRIWEVATGEERLRLAAGEPLGWAFFDAAGNRVLAAGRPGTKILVWDANSGALLNVLTFPAQIGDVMLSPRGELLFVATDDGHVRFCDAGMLGHGKRLRVRVLDAPDTIIVGMDIRPDGERLIVVGNDLTGRERDLKSWKPVGRPIPDCVVARYSPDGKSLVVGLPDGGARVLDAQTGELRFELLGHRERIQDVAFPPHGRSALTGSRDGTARLWDLRTGKGTTVFTAHASDVLSVAASRDGQLIATGSDDGTSRLWGARPPLFVGSTADALPAGPPVMVTPDGRRVLHLQGRDVEIWDPESGERVGTLTGHSGLVLFAAFSPDGRMAVTGTTDASDGVRVWDVESARLVATYRGHPGALLSASFDPLGERVVSTSLDDHSAHIFNARTGDLLLRLDGHKGRVECAAFSQDGRRVATGSRDGTLRTWVAATGKLEWQERELGAVEFVSFFAGDATLIAGTYRSLVNMFDGATGKVSKRFGVRRGSLLQAACHPGMGLVATRTTEATARVWSVSTGEEVLAIPAPEGGFRNVAFSADGARLYTLAGKCDLRAWPLDPFAVASAVRPRDLTPVERHRFDIGTPAEQAASRKALLSARLRRDLADAGRAVTQRPDDWRLRDHYVEILKDSLRSFLLEGDREGQEHVEHLLGEAALDPHADWMHLLGLAETLRLTGRDLEAMEALERAMRMPLAGTEAERALADLRGSFLPDLVTFASIDGALESGNETLIAPGAAWRIFRGRSEPTAGLEWAQPGFDDSSWEEGASGFGYADGDDGTVLENMQGFYTTVYARRKVALADPGRWSALVLSIRADDGFVAYVDGVEVARERAGPAGARLPFDAVAEALAPEPLVAREIRLPAPRAVHCVVAIQGLNQSKDSSDFSLIPELRAELPPRAGAGANVQDLLQSILGSSRPGAAARSAYLEGRLLEREGKPVEALARFEAAVTALAEGSASPEPFLRLAGCLEEMGRAVDAEFRLRAALERGIADSERLWDRWIALSFGRLGLDASAVLARLPPIAAESDRSGRGAQLRALLESLSADGAVRITCGGEAHVSKDGSRWLADAFHAGGYRYFGDRFGGAAGPFTGEILGTDDDPLFRTERWFPWAAGKTQGYTIPLPQGRWRVALHFAEVLRGEGWQRKFDVLVEGRVVATDFEPGAAGFATASSLSHDVEVADGRLEVELPPRPEGMQPKISAIEVRWLGPGAR